MVVNIRKEIPFSCAFLKKFASHIKFGENVYPSFYKKMLITKIMIFFNEIFHRSSL